VSSFVPVQHKVNWWLLTEVPLCGTSKPLQIRHSLNTHKGFTGLFALGAMWYYGCNTTAAWAYVGMHGTYGALWFVKDSLYRYATGVLPACAQHTASTAQIDAARHSAVLAAGASAARSSRHGAALASPLRP
jgi:hypothetical protein